MKELLISGIPEEFLRKLEDRASRTGRTVEQEALIVIETSLSKPDNYCAEAAAAIRNKLAGRNHTDSAILMAKDRGR